MRPSDQDVDFTDRIYHVGEFLKVPVLDHLIITEHSYCSFADTGLMDRIKASTKHLLPYEEKGKPPVKYILIGSKGGCWFAC